MILFNLKPSVTYVAIILMLMLVTTNASYSQTPSAKTEKVAATEPTSDSDVEPTLPDETKEPSVVAANVSPQRVAPDSSVQPTASELEAKLLARKAPFDKVVEPASIKKQDSSDDSEWHFGFAPYLFAAGISGTVGARGRTVEVDANFGNVWENLDMGLMGAFQARKGRFVLLNDLIWTKLSAEKDTPGPLYSTAKLGINLFILDPEVGYRLVDSEKGSLDVLGGVRIWSVETNINVTTGVLPGFDVSQRKSWAAPVVGLHGVVNITPKFFLAGKFDIGGAGIGADLTTQLYGAAGYRFTKHVALIGGYRWLQVDYDDDEGFIFDTQMSGLMFGVKFSW
jgi:hypothetical protein